MKWILLGAGILLAAGLIAALVIGAHRDAPEPIDGGLTDRTDPDAPKTIVSTELISFRCVLADCGAEDIHGICTLTAKKTPQGVQASIAVTSSEEGDTMQEFSPDEGFLTELAALIAAQGIAEHNGLDRYRAGLPDLFGAELEAHYASGETLQARDNQHSFLTDDAAAALIACFREAAGKTDP